MANKKLKTKKSAAKRFKISARGKIMHKRANHRHLLVNKSSRSKKRHHGNKAVQHCELLLVKRLIHS